MYIIKKTVDKILKAYVSNVKYPHIFKKNTHINNMLYK